MIEIILALALAATPTVAKATDVAKEEVIPTRIPGVIMVDGYGEVKALPDRVVLDVTLYSVENELAAAFSANDRIANEAKNLLLGLAIPVENIVVTNIQVQPEYDDKEQTRIKRYRIWRSLSVIIDDLKLAGRALDALLNSGAADVQMRRIYVKDSSSKQADAWKASLSDVSKKAREYSIKLEAPISRLEWASDNAGAYSIYRTRRSVILGKLREEAGAARDLATLMSTEESVLGMLEAEEADYEISAGEKEYTERGAAGGYDKRMKHAETKAPAKALYKTTAATTSSLSVSEQTFSSRFLANILVKPTMRPSLGEEGMIFIAGIGEARMRLDRANLTCRVQSVDKNLSGAYSDNDYIISKAQKELAKLGIKEEDIVTSNLVVYPEYQNEATGKIRRYRVTRDLKIKLNPLAVGEACAALVNAGVSDINGLSYELTDRKVLEEKARKAALSDARNRAELVAVAFEQNLGSLEWSSESPNNYSTYLFGKSSPLIAYPQVRVELNEMVANVTVYAHYVTYPSR